MYQDFLISQGHDGATLSGSVFLYTPFFFPVLSLMPDEQGPRLLRALRHRNYRLFFGGQSISLIGTWITRIATSWLVYRLTGSELLLGIVGFAGQIPLLILSPFAGVLVDRWDRHRILVITPILSALQSAALALLA